jgi:2-polyprenyl-6-hydroxyphenyl methylase/3-demethylubiquinone-9 3-methyltransferase
MNGVFTALDPVSASHRDAMARYLGEAGAKLIADYGGGFGELARAITRVNSNAEVFIVEPYPSRVGLEHLRCEPNIKFVSNLSAGDYDAIVAQDVLEHVADPIGLANEIASAVRVGGMVVFANCFYPYIQCHLPSTFHLRHTFPRVMKALGLRYLGSVEGALHVQVFRRTGALDMVRARHAELISRILGPALNFARAIMSHQKRLVGR